MFADLLIVLFIVGLGSATAPEIPDPAAAEEPLPKIVGMRQDPEVLTIEYDVGALIGSGARSEDESRLVCERIADVARPLQGQQAALALIFGGGQDIGVAQESAVRIAGQLPCADVALFDGTTTRDFWDGALPRGSARLEIFLFTTD
ncbi:hypothetical protein ACFWB0_06200 [Rhodococcus sp. NPDC060086]|uniref:hypothetical protein n=1 Tax=Rhodococcus sp. NPDC060086 TaxID=3347055 RepID=UPI003650174B